MRTRPASSRDGGHARARSGGGLRQGGGARSRCGARAGGIRLTNDPPARRVSRSQAGQQAG
ncbi:MAG: hypothetical protein E2O66_06290 [Deltaproteobacteria bacterium]|nr:MAG: hypothetical protein E2O66_06290 [Deltaproteobacteria bacterium]TDJ18485.1 MAG: hypothetical protein E2O69_06930 [Deltaproteobacteria bacterium]